MVASSPTPPLTKDDPLLRVVDATVSGAASVWRRVLVRGENCCLPFQTELSSGGKLMLSLRHGASNWFTGVLPGFFRLS